MTVHYTVAGDATPTDDYEALSGSVTIPTGQTTATIDVNAEFDLEPENDETVVVTLAPHPGGPAGYYTVDSPDSDTVTIEDRPPWKVSVEKIDDAAERADDSQPGKFKISRASTSGEPIPLDDPLTVRFQILPSSTSQMADPDADYTLTVPGGGAPADEAIIGTVTIPGGQAEVEIVVNAVNDDLREGDETVNIQLEPDTASIASYELDQANADLLIKDNDDWTVKIEKDSALYETGEGWTDPARLIVTRENGSDDDTTFPLTVYYTTPLADPVVDAENGVDYTALPGEVVIPAGSLTATFDVVAIDDDLNETDPEYAGVVLAENDVPGAGGYLLDESNSSADVAVYDNDQWHVSIEATTPTTKEGSPGAGQFTVTRTGASDTTNPLEVNYTVAGSATPTDDYDALSGTVTIPVGQTTATIDVSARLDGIDEGDETVIATLTAPSTPGAYTVDSPADATVIIEDHTPQVKITATKPYAFETGEVDGEFKIELTGGPLNEDLAVAYAVTGQATQGADYQSLAPAVIEAGEQFVLLAVRAINCYRPNCGRSFC